jgi:hypothetical protein
MTQKLLWFNVFTKHRFELQPELNVNEKINLHTAKCDIMSGSWKKKGIYICEFIFNGSFYSLLYTIYLHFWIVQGTEK